MKRFVSVCLLQVQTVSNMYLKFMQGHLRKSSAAVARHIDNTSASQEEEEEEDADEIRELKAGCTHA